MEQLNLTNLEFRNLSFCYEDGRPVLQNVDFKFPSQGFVQLRTHHSGMGKSSLLRILAGLVQPDSGQFIVNNTDVSDLSFEEFLPLRLQIGYSFDMGGLLNNRTLRENLTLPLSYHKWASAEQISERVNEIIQLFELQRVADLRPFAISGSQRKATCVARSLIMRPTLLILDEPTIGLSPHCIKVLKSQIQEGLLSGKLRLVIATSEDHRLLDGFDLHTVELHEHCLHYKENLKEVTSA